MAEAALLTERSGLQHRHGHVGDDVVHAPDFGGGLQGATRQTPGHEITQPGHLSHGGRLHPSLGCELPERVLITFNEPCRLCQYLTAVLFQLMASSEIQSEDSGDESHIESYQRHPSLWTVSLLLESLITLSERPDSVSRAS